MKRIVSIVWVVSMICTVHAFAGFKLKKDIYRIQQLKEAQDEAKAKGKAVMFLYTDADSTCGLATQAGLDAMSRLKSKAVVVYVCAKDERSLLPPLVQEAITSTNAGKFIPKTVIVNPEINTVIATVPYAPEKKRKRLFKNAKKAISHSMSTLSQNQTAPKTNAVPNASEPKQIVSRTWTSVRGEKLEALFVKLERGMVVLKSPEGKLRRFHINKFSKDDQLYVRKLTPTAHR